MTGQSPLDDTDRHAHILDLDLARDLAHTLTRELTFTRAHTRALARVFPPVHNLDHELVLALAHTRALTRALNLDRDLDLAHPLAHNLARDLDLNLAHARDLARDLARDFDLGHNLARDLARLRQALHRINAFIDQWERLDTSAEAKQPLAKEEPAPVAHLAERLVDVVMRLLPARHRGRYAEEFKAELHGLAQAKATSTVQVVYMLQQLGRVWKTRESLLRPALPRFHRLHRTACWVLATETRTWTPLTGLLLWGGIETTLDTGLGAAILTVVGAGAVFQAGVTWGRNLLGVEAQQRKSTE